MQYQKANSVGLEFFEHIRYEDFEFPIHMHRHPELVFVRSGCLDIQWGGQIHRAMPGDFALLLSNTVHAFSTEDTSSVDVCIFSEDFVPSFFRKIRGKQPNSTIFRCKEPIRTLFCDTVDNLCGQPDLFLLKSILYGIASDYLASVEFFDIGRKNQDLADRLIQYVSDNYLEPISLKTAAAHLGYEEHYLSRCFHKLVPMHFSQYVNLYRVTEATGLLQHTELSTSEIAMRSGFQSLRSFNRVYLEVTGKRPSQYRTSME